MDSNHANDVSQVCDDLQCDLIGYEWLSCGSFGWV
jgi:hypothetical protein